jgi:SAM-dependent methyltransferase
MIAMHGLESSLALGWRSAHDQLLRFEVLAAIADLNNHTILDAGCGYSDLYAYLDTRYTLSHYYGVEQIPELLNRAREQYGHLTNTTFISRSFLSPDLPMVDYILASGSLNYGSSTPGFIYKAIAQLYKHCKLGLGFNLLSTIPLNGLLVAYDPEEILTYCSTLSGNVVFKQDYADDDFTVFMYR